MAHFVVHDSVVFVQLQVQNHSLRSAQRDKLLSQRAYELIRVFNQVSGEAVHSEVEGS